MPQLDAREAFEDRLTAVVDSPEGKLSDVTFIVGSQKFGGLRGLLSLHSDVFHGMLMGEFREAQVEHPIELKQFDHAPEAFRMFLCFMHTGRLQVEDLNDVSALLEISTYFDVTDLSGKCFELVHKTEILPDNALELLSLASKHSMTDLLRKTWAVVGSRSDECLARTKDVSKLLPRALLRHVFFSSCSNVAEVTLVKILVELEEEERNDLAKLVRLPLIPAKQMMEVVVPPNLFDMKQCLEAMAWQSDPDSVKLPRQQTTRRCFFEGEGVGSVGYKVPATRDHHIKRSPSVGKVKSRNSTSTAENAGPSHPDPGAGQGPDENFSPASKKDWFRVLGELERFEHLSADDATPSNLDRGDSITASINLDRGISTLSTADC